MQLFYVELRLIVFLKSFKTVDWEIGILESSTPLKYVDYNNLDENSAFFNYYKSKGIINHVDNILDSHQKERVLKRLCELYRTALLVIGLLRKLANQNFQSISIYKAFRNFNERTKK